MITPPSNQHPLSPLPPRSGTPPAPDQPVATDQLSLAQTKRVAEGLAQTPEIRPEVVARAEALAVDPNYPPLAIIRQVADIVARSQDPSQED